MKSFHVLPLALCLCVAGHAQERFVNDICVPAKLWLLTDNGNDLFVQPFLKRWRPYNDFVRFSLEGGGTFQRRLSHVATIREPIDGSVLRIDLVNGDEFETVKTLKSTIRVGVAGAGSGVVTAQIVGDSYTRGEFYQGALAPKNVPNLKLVGLLKGGEGRYNEGRGGWSLAGYFNVPTRPVQAYHGFMQPSGEARYWGARAFWVNAWKCFRKTAPEGFEPTYSCSRYDDCLPRFEETTGILLNPVKGDIQYDNGNDTFVMYDGNTWKPVKKDEFTWTFDYGKYLAMWNVGKPDFLFVLLGLNDFRNRLDVDFTEWGKRITAMKDSYLSSNPNGKFIICIPCTSCGIDDNVAGDFTTLQNAAMWRFRDWLIKTFDRREQDGFHLVDTGIGTDNIDGYVYAQGDVTLPHFGYKGESRLRVQSGNPHPYPNYPNMGLPIAAFIQANRAK